jgi:hypothetical protein
MFLVVYHGKENTIRLRKKRKYWKRGNPRFGELLPKRWCGENMA